jgi:hypothetical protein
MNGFRKDMNIVDQEVKRNRDAHQSENEKLKAKLLATSKEA